MHLRQHKTLRDQPLSDQPLSMEKNLIILIVDIVINILLGNSSLVLQYPIEMLC